jgi:hypothetical protein
MEMLPWSRVGKMGDNEGRPSYVDFSGMDEVMILWVLSPGRGNFLGRLISIPEKSECW